MFESKWDPHFWRSYQFILDNNSPTKETIESNLHRGIGYELYVIIYLERIGISECSSVVWRYANATPGFKFFLQVKKLEFHLPS